MRRIFTVCIVFCFAALLYGCSPASDELSETVCQLTQKTQALEKQVSSLYQHIDDLAAENEALLLENKKLSKKVEEVQPWLDLIDSATEENEMHTNPKNYDSSITYRHLSRYPDKYFRKKFCCRGVFCNVSAVNGLF